MTLREALLKLDVSNDAHWTTDGSPMLSVLKDMLGEEGKDLNRGTLVKQYPNFNRKNTSLDAVAPNNPPKEEKINENKPKPEIDPITGDRINAIEHQETEKDKKSARKEQRQQNKLAKQTELATLKEQRNELNKRIDELTRDVDILIEEDIKEAPKENPTLDFLKSIEQNIKDRTTR